MKTKQEKQNIYLEDTISVVIACLNEEKYISKALDAILNMDYPKDNLEVFVIDGGSTDKTLKIVAKYTKTYSFIKLLNNKQKISPVAFNIGIQHAKGEYVVIMSAHTEYPSDYFKILTQNIQKYNADLLGGFLVTKTLSDTPTANAIKIAMMHKFGLGGAKMRTGTTKAQQVDTVMGMFKHTIFDKVGLFNEKLVRNQDMELSKRITEADGLIYIIPDTSATYYARDTYKSLWKNNYRNGLWIPLTIFITKKMGALSLRHFIPLIFILSLIVPVFLSIFHPYIILLAILSASMYLALTFFISWQNKTNKAGFFSILFSFFTLHFSYGIGSLVGIFKTIYKAIFSK